MLGWGKKKQQNTRNPRLMAGQNQYVFRRSRTLTGSTSARIAPAAPAAGQLKTERLKLHELRAQRNHIVRALTGVALVAAVLCFLISNVIGNPSVLYGQTGTGKPSTAQYQRTIQDYLGDHPIERFGFLLNTQDLGAYLVRQHNEVRMLEVDRAWYGGDVKFTFFFRKPLLVWKTGGQKFYVDDQGIAFDYNHFAEPAVEVTDQSGITPDSAGAVASTRFIAFLGKMVGAVNGYSKGVVTTVIIPASTREIDLKLQGRDYVIKTQSDRDPLEQAQDVAYAIGYFDTHKITPQYIDVRVSHKAFYK